MSTQKNEHNPETELTSKAEDWSVLKPFLRTTESVEIGSKSVVGHNRISIWREADDLVILHVPGHPCDYRLSNESIERLLSDLTTARRITPPTDTTGSEREGETPETDAEWSNEQVFPNGEPRENWRSAAHEMRDFARQLERQRDAALAQVEALRRDGERMDWLDSLNVKANARNGTIYGWLVETNHIRTSITDMNVPHMDIRAAIDSAQRQEGV